MDTKLFIYCFILIIEYYLIIYYHHQDIKYQIIKDHVHLNDSIDLNTFMINNLNNISNNLLLIPHLELGDNIVLNGAVRYYCKKYTKVILVCKILYYEQIKMMYSDLHNLLLFVIPENNDWLGYMKDHLPIDKKILKYYNVTFIPMLVIKPVYNIPEYFTHSPFPNHWYDELNLNLDIAYSYFKINRNYIQENKLYNKLVNIIGNDYIVIIDDEKRNFLIKDKYLSDIKYPFFKISANSKNELNELDSVRDFTIFNYIKILENAKMIISIESSIPWLIDMANINTPTYIHTYCRGVIYDCEYRNSSIVKINE